VTHSSVGYRTVRVFISSTFRDMQAERDHLVRAVFPRLREELLRRRIQLVDIDLRWGITEAGDVLTVCRDLIDQARPRFVCMLGGRYGWVAPRETHSVTADEIGYAVFDRSAPRARFAFFYFREPAATAGAAEDHPGQFREPAGSPADENLQDLKGAIVSAGFTPFVYPAHWDRDARRFVGLSTFGERVYTDLLSSIDKEFGIELPLVGNDIADEYAAMQAFAADRSESFVIANRDAILKRILSHAAADHGNPVLCIVGEAGSGKSALLAASSRIYYDSIAAPEESTFAYFVGATSPSSDARHVIATLCIRLLAAAASERATPKLTDLVNDDRLRAATLKEALNHASMIGRAVIFIDGIDQFKASHSLARELPSAIPENIRLVLSTQPGPALDSLRSDIQPDEIVVPLLRTSDGAQIVDAFLLRYGKAMSVAQRDALLLKADAGKPLYLRAALEELRTLGDFDALDARIANLPEGALPLLQWIVRRLETDDALQDEAGRPIGVTLVPLLSSLIAVSRNGLGERDLRALASPNTNPVENVPVLLRLLRPCLMFRGPLLDFYHAELKRAVERTYVHDSDARRNAHAVLARYCRDLADSATIDERGLRFDYELIYHHINANMWNELVECLNDPDVFDRLRPGTYGVDFDDGTYGVVDEEALTPSALTALSQTQRCEIAFAIADAFGEQAWRRIKQAQEFPQPWPKTAQWLRDNDEAGFTQYRNVFYSFKRIAERAAVFAAVGDDAAGDDRARLRTHLDRFGGPYSFVHYLEHFGSDETGLSHALEDDTSAYRAREMLYERTKVELMPHEHPRW